MIQFDQYETTNLTEAIGGFMIWGMIMEEWPGALSVSVF